MAKYKNISIAQVCSRFTHILDFLHPNAITLYSLKWEFVDSQNKATYSLELNMKTNLELKQ